MVGNVVGLVITLLPLLVVIAVVIALIRWRRSVDGTGAVPDTGLGTVRRLFLYGVGLLALIFSGVGLSLLLSGVVDALSGGTVISESDTELAFALSFSIVGIPAWLIAAFLAQRSLVRAPEAEVGSEVRRLYLNLARGSALVVAAVNAIEILQSLLRTSDFAGGPVGWFVVWLVIWLVHDMVVRHEARTPATAWLDQVYLGFASVFGLALLLSGLGAVLSSVLSAAYDGLFRSTLVQVSWSRGLREAVAPGAVGGVVWGVHWLLRLRGERRSQAVWQMVVFLFGVLPGVAMTLIPAAIALHMLLDWWIGNSAATAANHFAELPTALSVALLRLGVWAYFRSLLWEDAEHLARSDAERVYRYLVSAAGLLVLTGGIVAGLALAVEAGAPEGGAVLRSAGWWRDQLVLTLTLIIIGAPVWAWFWFGVQRVTALDARERVALPRRTYLFAIFGAATVTLLVHLTMVLFRFFDAVLGDGVTRELLVDVRWNAAFVLAAGIVAGYHWAVLREDQAAAPPEDIVPRYRRRTIVLVLPPGAEPLASALADLEGVRVRIWHRAGSVAASPPSEEKREELRTLVAGSEGDSLVLIDERGETQVVPLQAGSAGG